MSNTAPFTNARPVRVTGAITNGENKITIKYADGTEAILTVTGFLFHRDPATICGRDGCTTPVCEPYSTDNPWAAALCEVHVDTSFRCDLCEEWKSDDDHASGPGVPGKVACDRCYAIHLRDNPFSHRYPAAY